MPQSVNKVILVGNVGKLSRSQVHTQSYPGWKIQPCHQCRAL